METMQTDTNINASVQQAFKQLKDILQTRIIGQEKLIDRLLMALLCDGHLLVEGAPGLAKTKAIRELSNCIEGEFHRIQFTPDLLPADITGTEVYRYQEGTFAFQQGPLFHNLVLADEINRAPAKVQSALLEAMAERQITVGNTTYVLPELFLVMATQNPIEQQGTYSLPEAQLDRFLMYLKIDYPDIESEKKILALVRQESQKASSLFSPSSFRLSQQTIFAARENILNIYLSPVLENYIVQLIMATRQPNLYHEKLATYLSFGASPRGTISLEKTARAHAWLNGRDYVSPADVHGVIHDVLRHRLILSLEAQAENISPDKVIDELLKIIPIP